MTTKNIKPDSIFQDIRVKSDYKSDALSSMLRGPAERVIRPHHFV